MVERPVASISTIFEEDSPGVSSRLRAAYSASLLFGVYEPKHAIRDNHHAPLNIPARSYGR